MTRPARVPRNREHGEFTVYGWNRTYSAPRTRHT